MAITLSLHLSSNYSLPQESPAVLKLTFHPRKPEKCCPS